MVIYVDTQQKKEEEFNAKIKALEAQLNKAAKKNLYFLKQMKS